MPSTVYKGYEVQTTGSNSGAWGTVLNEDALEIIDRNVGGIVTKSLSSSNVILTSEESESLILRLTGTLSANVQITTSAQGITIVENLTSGAFDVTFTDGVASAVTLPQGLRSLILTDSTNGARSLTTGGLLAANNLDDVDSASTSRSNLGLEIGTDVLGVANNLSDVASAATAFGNIKQAASDSATGVAEIAVKSEMESASSTSLIVTPGRQLFHPAHPKAWANIDLAGSQALNGSYGITSLTDGGTGITTITFSTAFSDAEYGYVTGAHPETASRGGVFIRTSASGKTTTTIQMTAFIFNDAVFSAEDGTDESIAFFGAQ